MNHLHVGFPAKSGPRVRAHTAPIFLDILIKNNQSNKTMKQDFRNLIIDLLDSPDGIPLPTYQKMVEFTDKHFPNSCDDVWDATESGEGNNGVCIFLDEDFAGELKK